MSEWKPEHSKKYWVVVENKEGARTVVHAPVMVYRSPNTVDDRYYLVKKRGTAQIRRSTIFRTQKEADAAAWGEGEQGWLVNRYTLKHRRVNRTPTCAEPHMLRRPEYHYYVEEEDQWVNLDNATHELGYDPHYKCKFFATKEELDVFLGEHINKLVLESEDAVRAVVAKHEERLEELLTYKDLAAYLKKKKVPLTEYERDEHDCYCEVKKKKAPTKKKAAARTKKTRRKSKAI